MSSDTPAIPDTHEAVFSRLNERQKIFVLEYTNGATPGYAAEKAGYAHPKEQAIRLLKDPEVQAGIRSVLIDAGPFKNPGEVRDFIIKNSLEDYLITKPRKVVKTVIDEDGNEHEIEVIEGDKRAASTNLSIMAKVAGVEASTVNVKGEIGITVNFVVKPADNIIDVIEEI